MENYFIFGVVRLFLTEPATRADTIEFDVTSQDLVSGKLPREGSGTPRNHIFDVVYAATSDTSDMGMGSGIPVVTGLTTACFQFTDPPGRSKAFQISIDSGKTDVRETPSKSFEKLIGCGMGIK